MASFIVASVWSNRQHAAVRGIRVRWGTVICSSWNGYQSNFITSTAFIYGERTGNTPKCCHIKQVKSFIPVLTDTFS